MNTVYDQKWNAFVELLKGKDLNLQVEIDPYKHRYHADRWLAQAKEYVSDRSTIDDFIMIYIANAWNQKGVINTLFDDLFGVDPEIDQQYFDLLKENDPETVSRMETYLLQNVDIVDNSGVWYAYAAEHGVDLYRKPEEMNKTENVTEQETNNKNVLGNQKSLTEKLKQILGKQETEQRNIRKGLERG